MAKAALGFKERVQRILWALQLAGIRDKVEILPDMPTLQELLKTYVLQYEVEHVSPTMSIYKSKSDDQEIKTQLTADGEITCSCKGHLRDSTFSCVHIGEFCLHRGIDVPGGWFALARRLDPSFIAQPAGQPKEATKRNRAYRTMPQRIRKLAYELCKDIPDPAVWPKNRRAAAGRAGAKPIPLRALLYCLLVKVAFSKTYYGVQEEDVNRDSYIKKLGWKRGVPNWNAMCEALGDPDIRPHLERMLRRTAALGRVLDYALMIDGSGFGTTLLRNWRGSKYGGKVRRKKKPKKMQFDGDAAEEKQGAKTLRNIFELSVDEKRLLKKFRGYIKVHCAAGAVSGLIYAIAPTLNFGAGAGDTIHFIWLVEQARKIADFEAVIADKAYESARNFGFAAAAKLLMFVLPRRGDTLDTATPEAKHLFDMMNQLREDYPDIYRRFYRLRSKIETFFSSMKRTNGYIRTKIRNGDIDRMFGLRHDPYPLKDSAPKWIHDNRAELCRMLACARVGDAHANEAFLKAIAMNLRTLCRLEAKYGEFNLNRDIPIPAVPRISLPRSA